MLPAASTLEEITRVLTLAQDVKQVMQTLARLTRLAKLDADVVEPVIKVVGISIVTRIGCEVCRGAGEGGIASFVDVAGTVLSLAAALPLVNGVVALIAELMG